MTVSSWFRSDKPPLQDTLKHLYPPTAPAVPVDDRNRFSQLLLEHGEKPLQDWAVVAYSNALPEDDTTFSNKTEKRSSKIQWQQQQPQQHQHKKAKQSSTSSRRTRSKESVPSAHMTKIEGRLHLCSRSLVFEPHDTTRPLIRCPFTKMEAPPRAFPPDAGYDPLCVQCVCKRHVVIAAKNRPFESVHLPVQFQFTFLHSAPTQLVDLSGQLFEILAASRAPGNTSQQDLEALLKSLQDRPFDSNNLLDVRESVMTTSLRCSILTPLQAKPGVLVVTSERIYFQAVAGDVQTWWLSDVAATARRYHGLRDCALEVYFANNSVLFALERRHDREQVLRSLPSKATCFTDRDFVVRVVQAWLEKRIGTFEYLLALNVAAGRSFHDLSRYPVFPWILSDYTSSKLDLQNPAVYRDLTKPVGALNAERLEYFQSRMESLQDMGEDAETFLYGTHYSAPGYVLYYLVRSMPEQMLCLQNGKFDAPDRMFHSIAACYRCVLTNHADVKEVIPEFYHTRHFDFLLNCAGLPLGATQNGDRVNDVQLPPWARSARDFVKKQRAALESDYVRQHLPAWVDLMFGVTSRGAAALEASNLFHETAYMGPTDLARMATEQERMQAELQATEFGIVPDQLFVKPHPVSGSNKTAEEIVSLEIGRASSFKEEREAWELLDRPPSEQDLISPSSLSVQHPEMEDTRLPKSMSLGSEGGWKSQSRESNTSEDIERESDSYLSPQRSAESAHTPAESHLDSPQIQPFPESKAASQWDMKMVERRAIHNDAVSGCVLLLDDMESKQSILATTSLDGGLKVHNVVLGDISNDKDKGGFTSTLSRFSYNTIMNRGGQGTLGASQSNKLTEYRTHSSHDPLASLVLAQDGAGGSVAFAGGHDDVVLAYGVNSACAVASVYSHRDAVTGLTLIPRLPFQSGQLWPENSTHILISGSWDATVKVWSATVAPGETVSVNREPLAELFDADSSIVCVSALSIPTGGIVIGAGCADGSFCVWNVHGDGVQVVLHKEAARRGSGPCSVVQWVSSGGTLHMFAAFSTGKVASYSLVDGRVLERRNAVSVGVSILSLVYAAEGFLLVGCADGGLRLIPVREGAYFHAKPTLWPAVNDKSAPGISSIAYTSTASGGRFVCCTGGEDGSIALFELKQVLS